MDSQTLTPHVDVRRAADRYATDLGWLDSHHSFSFGHHHDRTNTHHGLLLVNNDDVVDAGTASRPTRTGTWRSSPGCSTAPWCTRTPPATTA